VKIPVPEGHSISDDNKGAKRVVIKETVFDLRDDFTMPIKAGVPLVF
jgi:hypothetical protein